MRTRRSQSSSSPMPLGVPEEHRSVLCHEAVEALQLQHDDIVVDATLGGGGHARAIEEHLWREGTLIGFDIDSHALMRAHRTLESRGKRDSRPGVILINANFRYLATELKKRGVTRITKVLFDLGWSSYQLDSGRGFSFKRDEPLLMTYESAPSAETTTAQQIVNEWKESTLADVIFGFGEERYARRIAKAIVEHRSKRPIQTSSELADLVRSAVPSFYRKGRIDPATKTFQAIRIAVNDELGALKDGLQSAWHLLSTGGRIAVITFHSLEDRIVKRMFADLERSGAGRRVTKKPIIPTHNEIQQNPRARSAKLRVIEKIAPLNHERENSENKQIQAVDFPGAA